MRLKKWLVGVSAVLAASCVQLDAATWQAQNPAKKIAANQEALLDALDTDTGYDYSRTQRAVHLLELLLKETRDEQRRYARVRWDLVALVLQEEPAATAPLYARLYDALGNSSFAGYPGFDYADRDRITLREVEQINKLCPTCLQAYVRNVSLPLYGAAAHGWHGTASFVIAALGPYEGAALCGRVNDSGQGLMEVAASPEMRALFESCGAREHTAEEQDATREASRDRARAADAEREYYDRLHEERVRRIASESRAADERYERERVQRERREQAEREERIQQMGDLNMGLPTLTPQSMPTVMRGTAAEVEADGPSSAAGPNADGSNADSPTSDEASAVQPASTRASGRASSEQSPGAQPSNGASGDQAASRSGSRASATAPSSASAPASAARPGATESGATERIDPNVIQLNGVVSKAPRPPAAQTTTDVPYDDLRRRNEEIYRQQEEEKRRPRGPAPRCEGTCGKAK